MDAEPTPARSGGSVEPANRAAVAKERFQTPMDLVGERYEVRDPFAEVTYRARTSQEIAAKAEQLGAMRFYAVDLDGKRTPINKVEGEWRRADPPTRPTEHDVREDLAPAPLPTLTTPKPPEADLVKIDLEAERVARAERLQAALTERYVIKRAPLRIGDATLGQTEYRFKGDTTRVAFTESTFRLSTDTNSPSVARSMVDVAQARNWQALRVSGHEDFKRLVWLEASVRGVKALGYEPQPADMDLVRRERATRQVNHIEAALAHETAKTGTADSKQSSRGGGRKAVLAALEAVLVAKRVPERQRHAVMAAAEEKLAKQIAAGQTHRVKVYDKSAPPERQMTRPAPEQQRTRERVQAR
jgi:hypothetical protein